MAKPAVTDLRSGTGPVVLLILDGWGLSPSWSGNAIALNDPPTFSYLWKYYPHAVLQAFRKVPGVTSAVGSSEIGHASIGSGRLVEQDLVEINRMIDDGQFFANPTLIAAFDQAVAQGKAVHLTGLLSDGGVHGDHRHAHALVRLARQRGVTKLWLHPILDGRDVELRSAHRYIDELERALAVEGVGRIATVAGRHYAMDKGEYWDRTALTYEGMVFGHGRRSSNAHAAVTEAYDQGLDDEHVRPTVLAPTGTLAPGDVVVHWNFRADRGRQLVQALIDRSAFRAFPFRRRYPLAGVSVVTLTDYHLELPQCQVAFPSATISNTLGQLVANRGLRQLRVAEREKYAHVTYFFNGGREEPYEGEDRVIVPSPRVPSYDAAPEMGAAAITRVLERAIAKRSHHFIVANYGNVDMVAHTGNLLATGRAVLVVDEAVRRVANAVMDAGGRLIITADHGNGEAVATLHRGDRETLHTFNSVPFVYVAPDAKQPDAVAQHTLGTGVFAELLRSTHTLADVAPTILELLGIPKPSDMTGSSLLGTWER